MRHAASTLINPIKNLKSSLPKSKVAPASASAGADGCVGGGGGGGGGGGKKETSSKM